MKFFFIYILMIFFIMNINIFGNEIFIFAKIDNYKEPYFILNLFILTDNMSVGEKVYKTKMISRNNLLQFKNSTMAHHIEKLKSQNYFLYKQNFIIKNKFENKHENIDIRNAIKITDYINGEILKNAHGEININSEYKHTIIYPVAYKGDVILKVKKENEFVASLPAKIQIGEYFFLLYGSLN